jgi:hypothetical protein
VITPSAPINTFDASRAVYYNFSRGGSEDSPWASAISAVQSGFFSNNGFCAFL